jgi:hypothetical protein
MRIKILILLVLGMVLVSPFALTPESTFAVNVFSQCDTTSSDNCQDCTSGTLQTSDICNEVKSQDGTDPVITLIKIVINILSYGVGIVSVIIIIISGLRMIFNGSDSQAVSRARNAVIYAAIGIAVTVFSQLIVVFVLDKLT